MVYTKGRVFIKPNAPVGPRGAKKKTPIRDGGWNVVSLVLKTLRGTPYKVIDTGSVIIIRW